jgi:hypothetical protein
MDWYELAGTLQLSLSSCKGSKILCSQAADASKLTAAAAAG